MKMLKTILLSFVALHAVTGQVRKPHPKIGKVTCVDLRPQGDTHNRGVEDPSDFSQQYEIEMSYSQMKSWQTLDFVISGKDGNTMRGFIIQVRPEGSNRPVGSFLVQVGDGLVDTIDCGGIKNTALLKFPKPPKKYRDFPKVMFSWSPRGYYGKVNIIGTIIKTGNVFWVSRKLNDLMIYKTVGILVDLFYINKP